MKSPLNPEKKSFIVEGTIRVWKYKETLTTSLKEGRIILKPGTKINYKKSS